MSPPAINTFWSLLIEPGKTYERIVESGIHVTRCALDTSAVKSEADEGLVQVILEHLHQPTTVANLSVKHSIFQTDLDLFFQCGEQISFTTSGAKIPVTLTGLCGVDVDSEDDQDNVEETCDDTIDETFEAEEGVDNLGKRKIRNTSVPASKKSKLSGITAALNDVTLASDSDSDDEHYNPVADDCSMLVDEAEDIETEETDSEEDDDDSDDVEEESDDEDDDDEDEEVEEEESPVEESPVKTKKPKKSLDSNAIKALKPKTISPERKSTPKPSKVEKLKHKEINKSQTSTPNGTSKAKEGKKMSNGKENGDIKNIKVEKKLKESEAKGTPKSEKKKKSKQILAGSVTAEDHVTGQGKVAKNNSMLRQ